MTAESAARGTAEENERPGAPPSSETLAQEKRTPKLVRMASVIVYTCAITGNGFLLSLFFLFIWDPQIKVIRPPDVAPDRGLFGRLTADPLIAQDDEGIVAQALKDPEQPIVPYHRIMSNEFTNKYIKNFHGNIDVLYTEESKKTEKFPGSNSDIPEPSHVLASSEQEEYENYGSTVKPDASSPQNSMESKIKDSNIGSEEGKESTSTSGGGSMAKPKKADAAVASTAH